MYSLEHDVLKKCAHKASAIAYSVFRATESISDADFKVIFRKIAYQLLFSVCRKQTNSATEDIFTLHFLPRLGADIVVISAHDSETLIAESNALYELLLIYHHVSARPVSVLPEQIAESDTSLPDSEILSQNEAKDAMVSDEIAEPLPVSDADERKSKITKFLSETGESRFPDIREHFPDVSERTVRYDLQTLAEMGIVEKMGHSGPNTKYRLRA